MRWSRLRWLLVVAAFLVSMSPGAWAGGLPEAEGNWLAQGDASGKVQEVEDRFSPRLQQLKIQVQAARLELAQQLAAPSPDRERVRAAMDRMLDLERQEQHLLLEKVFATLEVLRPEERSRYIRSIVDLLTR